VLLLLSSLCRDAACSVHPTSGGEGAFQHNGSGFSLLLPPSCKPSRHLDRGLLFHLMPPTKASVASADVSGSGSLHAPASHPSSGNPKPQKMQT